MTLWTDAHVSQLKEMWHAGMSASAIANELGGFSRNAILGKVDRLGLETHKVVNGERHGRHIQINRRNHAVATVLDIPPPRPSIDDAAIPLEQRRTILSLGLCECRYPVGTGAEMFFCGGPVVGDSSYCRPHHDRCTERPNRSKEPVRWSNGGFKSRSDSRRA